MHVGPSDSPAAAFELAGQYLLMPAAISVRLARRELEASGAAAFEVRVENLGRREVTVALEAEDHAGQRAFAFDRPRLTIARRAVAQATLIVTPPDQHPLDARWPFDVRARPTAPSGPPAQVAGILVDAPPRIAVRLRQPEVEAVGPGVFSFEVENLGTREVTVSVSAADATHACRFAFNRPGATIAPGAISQFALTVTPPDDHPPDARWRFDMLASPADPRAETARVSAVLVYRPPTVRLMVTPPQASARRAARFVVSVHNPFQLPQTIGLAAADPAGRLHLRWPKRSPDVTVKLPPSGTIAIELRVSPIVRHRGTEPRPLVFSVAATPVWPPGYVLSAQAQFVALPARQWPGRRALLIGAGAVLGLLALLDVEGIGWPELLVAVAPLVGGIILRTVWWGPLYPAGLAAGLQAAERQPIREWFNITSPSWTEITTSADALLIATLGRLNRDTPNGVRDLLTDSSRWCEVSENQFILMSNILEQCAMTEWSILTLMTVCALIGTVVGKGVAKQMVR